MTNQKQKRLSRLGICWGIMYLVLTCVVAGTPEVKNESIKFRITSQVQHKIDPRIFGQFMERPSWGGEIGAEGALTPATRQLQPEVVKLLQQMTIPIIRFPGGIDVDFVDWCDMIDNAPGRGKDRPDSIGCTGEKITNNFGYDEFLQLCEKLKSEPIIVVNFRDALLNKKPLPEAAQHAASLVAYCNTPVKTQLPDNMPDWPAVRAKNGRNKPYGVKYFQIGNETWNYKGEAEKELGLERFQKFYVECLAAYIEAMRAIDPSIKIIVDYLPDIPGLIHKQLGDKVQYLARHFYLPWTIEKVLKEGREVPLNKLSPQEIWYAWVALPQTDDNGQSIIIDQDSISEIKALGYKVAVTEWNWNGWWADVAQPPYNSKFARGIGAAGFLHAFMRMGDVMELGCQSLLVGNAWDITGIRVNVRAQKPPYFMPTGQVTMFYSKYHGDNLLVTEALQIPTYIQPYQMGFLKPQEKVAYIDALATASDQAIYFHAINRHFNNPMKISIDLSDFSNLTGQAVHHIFESSFKDKPERSDAAQIGSIRDAPIRFTGKTLNVTLPNRTVSCIEIKRK